MRKMFASLVLVFPSSSSNDESDCANKEHIENIFGKVFEAWTSARWGLKWNETTSDDDYEILWYLITSRSLTKHSHSSKTIASCVMNIKQSNDILIANSLPCCCVLAWEETLNTCSFLFRHLIVRSSSASLAVYIRLLFLWARKPIFLVVHVVQDLLWFRFLSLFSDDKWKSIKVIGCRVAWEVN